MEKEKEIQLEMNDIEQQIKMKRATLESVKQLESQMLTRHYKGFLD